MVLTNIYSSNDTVTLRKAIEKYQNHPSIKVIRENIDTNNNFSFDLIHPECISKIINDLDTSKATHVMICYEYFILIWLDVSSTIN